MKARHRGVSGHTVSYKGQAFETEAQSSHHLFWKAKGWLLRLMPKMFLGPRIILHDNILDPVPHTFFS